tara:strand:- start:641 stop:1237 length:597 start_codon:yes stop_codon:yes gene_type:complete
MKVEHHFLLIACVLILTIVILYFVSDCTDALKVADTNDPRVDLRPIWLCHDENDKSSRIKKLYSRERKLQSMGVLDKWSITHVTHGVMFFGILLYLNNYKKSISLLYGVILIEILWEIFENTAFIINKYRRSRTLYRDYSGDSIANMISDTLFTLLGVALVWNLSFKMILPTFILLEVITYILINDTILINIYSLTMA